MRAEIGRDSGQESPLVCCATRPGKNAAIAGTRVRCKIGMGMVEGAGHI